jgi:hypothetical protein
MDFKKTKCKGVNSIHVTQYRLGRPECRWKDDIKMDFKKQSVKV